MNELPETIEVEITEDILRVAIKKSNSSTGSRCAQCVMAEAANRALKQFNVTVSHAYNHFDIEGTDNIAYHGSDLITDIVRSFDIEVNCRTDDDDIFEATKQLIGFKTTYKKNLSSELI